LHTVGAVAVCERRRGPGSVGGVAGEEQAFQRRHPDDVFHAGITRFGVVEHRVDEALYRGPIFHLTTVPATNDLCHCWLPAIIKAGSGRGIGTTGLLSAAPYALATIAMLAISWASDRSGRRRVFVWPSLLVGAAAFYASYLVGSGHFMVSFGLLIVAAGAMYAPYGPYFALIPELLPANVAGVGMGAVNAFGALGGFAGAYVVGLLGGGTQSGRGCDRRRMGNGCARGDGPATGGRVRRRTLGRGRRPRRTPREHHYGALSTRTAPRRTCRPDRRVGMDAGATRPCPSLV